MWVVKLGGSLAKSADLSTIVRQLADHGAGQMVIVPGGGMFADQVRFLQSELNFDDITAHRLALRAMEQFGTFLSVLDPRYHAANSIKMIHDWLERGEIPVWYPYDMVADNPVIRATWDITSDSLALWLANTLECHNLVMIKSTEPDTDNYSAAYLSEHGYLDHAFAELVHDTFVRPWWLFHKQLDYFIRLLDTRQDTVSGLHAITTR